MHLLPRSSLREQEDLNPICCRNECNEDHLGQLPSETVRWWSQAKSSGETGIVVPIVKCN